MNFLISLCGVALVLVAGVARYFNGEPIDVDHVNMGLLLVIYARVTK